MLRKYFGRFTVILCCAAQINFFSSCAEDLIQHWADTPIKLVADSKNKAVTRATTDDIQGNHFDSGASIYTYIDVAGASDGTTSLGTLSAPLLFKAKEASGGINELELDGGDKVYYPAGDDMKVNIYALHPIKDPFTTHSFSVKANQVSDDDYRSSDLIYASVLNQYKTSQVVHLLFEHEMSKLIINTEGKNDVRIKKVILKNFATTVAVSPTSSSFLGDNSDYADIVVIDNSSANEYPQTASGAVLFPPQKITTKFIEVETNLGTAYFYIDSKTFEKGRQYTVNLAISSLNMGEEHAKMITHWVGAGTVTVAAAGSTGFTFSGDVGPYTYNRSAFEPNYENDGLKVMDDETELVEGNDYSLDYYNNVNAGTAIVVAVGKGTKYQGFTAVKSFTINQAAFDMVYEHHGGTADAPDVVMEYVHEGTVDNPLLLNTGAEYDATENLDDGTITYTSSNESIAEVASDGTVTIKGSGGQTTITATMDGTGNYAAGSTSYILKINAKQLDPTTDPTIAYGFVETPNFVYDGDPKTPAVYVKVGDNVLTDDDYDVGYSNNENAGTATVTITGKGQYATDTPLTLNFDIAQATTAITMTAATKTIDIGNATARSKSLNNALGNAGSYDVIATSNLNPAKTGITIRYRSESPSIAAVDANGHVTPVAVGGPVKIYAYVDANSPNYTNAEVSTVNITVEQMTFFWDCNRSMRTWSLPATAYYTFELVGGGGGCDGINGGTGGIVRARSNNMLPQNTTVYVFVGGGGSNEGGATPNQQGSGGWNGGGYAGPSGSSGGGGGASDIRIGGNGCGTTTRPANSTGTTWGSNYGGNPAATTTDNRVLIAGGGGGASNGSASGRHGGDVGSGNTSFVWKGADKTSGDGGGGGGGYRGGQYGGDGEAGGVGGSNYISTSGSYPFTVCKDSEGNDINGPSDNGPNWTTAQYNAAGQVVYTKKWDGWIIASYSYE